MPIFASQLLAWYRKNRRVLPWRGRTEPYAVWISEIMSQQTRVQTVVPYFRRWMSRFPTVKSLAEASEQEVLGLWEGLGYYARARNLRKTAIILVSEYHAKLPRDPASLCKLPGIGRYTAGAIASIAFGMDVPTLDGNIRRVLARVFDVSSPADSKPGQNVLWALAEKHLPPGRAGDYNQALMELGAVICLPKAPRCRDCPVAKLCRANALGIQDRRPILKKTGHIPHYVEVVAVIEKAGTVLLAKRPPNGLLGGMWEFPNARVGGDPAMGFEAALKSAYGLRVRRKAVLTVIRHAYSHFTVTAHAFSGVLISLSSKSDLRWVNRAELDSHPMGRIHRLIARELS